MENRRHSEGSVFIAPHSTIGVAELIAGSKVSHHAR